MWQVATESTSKQVIESAAKLLVMLHQEVKPELLPQTPAFDDMFINKCFSIIEAQRPEIASRPEQESKEFNEAFDALPFAANAIVKLRLLPVQERKIRHAIFLLRQLIRMSEKNGIFNLRPHAALSKGTWFDCI